MVVVPVAVAVVVAVAAVVAVVVVVPRWCLPRRSKLERAVDEGLLLGEPSRGRFEALRESAQGRRAAQLAQSLGVFISCHIDGKMAAGSRWVTVVATRFDTTTSRVKREGGAMRGNVQQPTR